jgi:hypothetical protein
MPHAMSSLELPARALGFHGKALNGSSLGGWKCWCESGMGALSFERFESWGRRPHGSKCWNLQMFARLGVFCEGVTLESLN